MANLYFGDGNTDTNGNWYTTGNWFSSPNLGTSSNQIPAISAGRIATGTDFVTILDKVTNGPSSFGFTGNILVKAGDSLFLGTPGYYTTGQINDGYFLGDIRVLCQANLFGSVVSSFGSLINSGIFYGTISLTGDIAIGPSQIRYVNSLINNGTFYGPVSLLDGGTINGGVFYKEVITPSGQRVNNSIIFETSSRSDIKPLYQIFSGLYSPSGQIILLWSGNQPIISGRIYNDPGFVGPNNSGGKFLPQYSYINFPNILGAGLL